MKGNISHPKPKKTHPWKKKCDVPPKMQPWEVKTIIPNWRPVRK